MKLDFDNKEVEVKYIKADVAPRYWEDTSINGVADTESGTNIPFKKDDAWIILVDLETGIVKDWPAGIEADIFYKICDGGLYFLLDESEKAVAFSKSRYVPRELQVLDNDNSYLNFKIFANGQIEGWQVPAIQTHQWSLEF